MDVGFGNLWELMGKFSRASDLLMTLPITLRAPSVYGRNFMAKHAPTAITISPISYGNSQNSQNFFGIFLGDMGIRHSSQKLPKYLKAKGIERREVKQMALSSLQ